jgi:transcriptional regulator with XRE-family HTH domain
MAENEAMTTMGERLQTARIEAGFSQQALARAAKCGQSTIASIENGRNKGSTKVARLAQALEVSALWLSEGKGPMRLPDSKSKNTPPDLSIPHTHIHHVSERDNTLFLFDAELMRLMHDAPLVSTEDIMKKAHTTPFFWRSTDDHVGTGRPVAAPQGYLALIDPALEPEAGDLLLIKTHTGRIMLRRLAYGGQVDYLVTDSGTLPPIPISDCEILGLAITAMPEPAKRKRKAEA